ncbi:glycerophosphodiester phosphodiesterase family protein [Chitinophaga filiformis]|uniref:glycerophosphodiester phosphodiesterase n=1 Tax=Chitinophaga filiformis TaxID=104663 RepID=UPI001F487ECC|nr:glycerophosphodiester phosphodiesterase family protein [Chitinophaga filiformis]MCF6406041.1 glycerophosphodiester phosphodiesterase family protein [Chitinophaga filiformis]
MKKLIVSILFSNLLLAGISSHAQSARTNFRLIAHRGGIVDSTTDQNSLQALNKAIKKGYWMVEIDLRMTKDSVLVTHHDKTFKNSFGLDAPVSSMTWEAVSKLRNANGYRVLKLEEVLRHCKGKLGVMIDNKLSGNDTVVWMRLISLLKKYDLYSSALMIGTDESTEFFTGKIKLSCTRQQLEDNMRRAYYKSSNYYLFSDNISKDDNDWASRHDILVVGVINAWAFHGADAASQAAAQAERLKAAGVRNFQIDAEYAPLLGY